MNAFRGPRAMLAALIVASGVAAGVQSALARGGGGPSGFDMTKKYCTEMVVDKGVTDVARFQEEVRKCLANPVTYPPAYKQTW
jgi:hypothetical protein